MSESPANNEITIIRDYEAPIQTVWRAWTDHQILDQWWGPRGFSNKTQSLEMKSGGKWRFTMHGPNNVDYENLIRYIDVVNHRQLVYDHGTDEGSAPHFRVTVTFAERDSKTRMVMTMTFPTADQAQASREFIRQVGGESTWDRLSEFLIKSTSGRDAFVINRSFEVPLKIFAEIWTNPAHLAQWLSPKGATMQFIRADLRPGGSCFYVMDMGQGRNMFGRSSYLKIEKPHTIIYTQQFCDKDEKIMRHPMSPNWPETVQTTVTLRDEGERRTRVNLVWEPYGIVPLAVIETFINARAGMTQGWNGSFDKLEEYANQVMASSNMNSPERAS